MSHRAFDGRINNQTLNGVDGYNTVIRAQNSTGTNARGGNLILGSGTGTLRDGYVKIELGTSGSVLFNPDGYVSTDGYLKVDGITLDGYSILFDGYVTTPTIRQSSMPTNGVDGYNLLLKAQNSTSGSNTHGGNLMLQGGDGYNGDGYFRDGYVQIYSGTTEVARAIPNRLSLVAGQRIRIDDVSTTPFTIPDGYFVVLVDTSGSAMTINLPATPTKGDIYQVKDKNGNSTTNIITVQGNGHNIDGAVSYQINSNYATVVFAYNGSTWSVL